MPPTSTNSPVTLREVTDADLPIFFEHQCDPEANQMAAFPAREREVFMAHWAKIRVSPSNILRTILFQDQVVGNIVSWETEGWREVGYWLGEKYWGQGWATCALALFLAEVPTRPVYAYVAKHNHASRRVLEKCGFVVTRVEQTFSATGELASEGLTLELRT